MAIEPRGEDREEEALAPKVGPAVSGVNKKLAAKPPGKEGEALLGLLNKNEGEPDTETKMKAILNEIKLFNTQVFPLALKMLKILQSGQAPNNVFWEDSVDLEDSLTNPSLFQVHAEDAAHYREFLKQTLMAELQASAAAGTDSVAMAQLVDKIIHDLIRQYSECSRNASFLKSSLKDKEPASVILADLKNFCVSWPLYAGAFVDSLVNFLSASNKPDIKKYISSDYNPGFEGEHLGLAITGLADSFNLHRQDYLRKKSREDSLPLKQQGKSVILKFPEVKTAGDVAVLQDKVFIADTAKLINFLSNVVGNACVFHGKINAKDSGQAWLPDPKSSIDADRVKILVGHGGRSELVIRVVDDGKGMTKEQLDPKSPAFIFNTKVSGLGGTGLGLQNPKLLSDSGITVNVVSRARGADIKNAASFSNAKANGELPPPGRDELGALLEESKANTVFEIIAPMVDNAEAAVISRQTKAKN